MDPKTPTAGYHAAVTCRWAVPTLYLERPLWIAAWDTPWTCTYREDPAAIETTDRCADCRAWEPKPEERR